MPRPIQYLLLLASLLANAVLLFVCFNLLSQLKHTYTEYRHFRALPIGTSQATTAAPNQAADAVATPNASSTPKTIVLFGDSRVETWNPIPAVPNTQFINAGVTGETTSEMMRRFERDVVRLKPHYVIMQSGMNDLTASVTKGIKDPALLIDTMHTNMHFFISTLESQGIEVIVTSIIPNKHLNFKRKQFWTNTLTEQVQRANIKLKQTTESLGADWLDLDPLYIDKNGDPIEKLFRDTLHLNGEGYTLLNSELSTYLGKLPVNSK